jgi:hypothetical protein
MNGVIVAEGDYQTEDGKSNASLAKGNVTVKSTGIEVSAAQGGNYSGDESTGHFILTFDLKNVAPLNLTGYKGIRIETGGFQGNEGYIGVSLKDATGKSTVSWGETDELQIGITFPVGKNTAEGLFTENMGGTNDSNGWGLDYSKFTHKINGMYFDTGMPKDIAYNDYKAFKITIKSIVFF